MENREHGLVDLLEIYHARQMQRQIMNQLQRLQSEDHQVPLSEVAFKCEVVAYYETLLITVAEMLHQMGDTVTAD